MEHAIFTEGLSKTCGPTRALDGVSLRVPRGQVFAPMCPNWAGKTTFARVLSTLIRPTGGWALVSGHDVTADPGVVRARISLTGRSPRPMSI